ncbi:MAG: aminomethyl-transferring glycine dehydrogenase subunit GcvPA [Betaproteobacteria bacterium]|nr:aminomethyl-transferring glycine dehydrogenase subunit GcvPA [Betaproteobacteria bacterium]
MPFIPHTDEDVSKMLAAIGAARLEDLFDEIPPRLCSQGLSLVPPGVGEMEILRLMQARAERDGRYANFIGAGAYEHHIPAAVWEIAGRGEFYSAYTPYQAEASQGTLQVIYEYQSMMAGLMAMEVSNASLYDGASAFGEAILMAVRAHKGARRILVPKTVHPTYRKVASALVKSQGIELIEIDYDPASGTVGPLPEVAGLAALVVAQPNFFGRLEAVDALTDWAHDRGALVIALLNPMAAALFVPPGEWGREGADIAVGEGQPLGVPLSAGGPYFGFMCCKESLVRQMPGRLVGRTVDLEGRAGFTLTLQAREQHIRRSKATSNICTNQGLLVLAATVYMALLGAEGLARVAAQAHANTRRLIDRLTAIPGVRRAFAGPFFHEAVIQLDLPARELLRAMRAQGILGGLDLAEHYPELGAAILVCVTETKTEEDIDQYVAQFERIATKRRDQPPCAYKPT